jgi:hypothetical protein
MAHDPLSTPMPLGGNSRKPAITIRGLLVITLLIAFALLFFRHVDEFLRRQDHWQTPSFERRAFHDHGTYQRTEGARRPVDSGLQ